MIVWIVPFKVNQTKIKAGSQSRRKVVTHDSKSDSSLINRYITRTLQDVSGKFQMKVSLCTYFFLFVAVK